MPVTPYLPRDYDGLDMGVGHVPGFFENLNDLIAQSNLNESGLGSHVADTSNPHSVTAAQIGLSGALKFAGAVAVPGDFPDPASVENGDVYRVTAQVTDSDPTKTNTGQSFEPGDEIAWNDTLAAWVDLGHLAAWAAREIHVDPVNGDDTYPGTPNAPFRTAQAAIDYAETSLSPGMDDQVAIMIHADDLDENLVIREDGIHLVGCGGQGVTRVRPASGPSLIVTNADAVSLAAFLAAGGHADPMTHYGLLADGGTTPRCNQFKDLAFGGPGGAGGNDIMLLGVGAGAVVGGSEWNFMRCTVWHNVFARTVNYIAFQNDTWIAGNMEQVNCAGLWLNRSQIDGDWIGVYDAGAYDEPSDAGNYGLAAGAGSMIRGSIVASAAQRVGAGQDLSGLIVRGNVDLNDTARAHIDQTYVNGDLDVEGDAEFIGRNVWIDGDVTLANAGGLVACFMYGGGYRGVLTDAGARLTFANWSGGWSNELATHGNAGRHGFVGGVGADPIPDLDMSILPTPPAWAGLPPDLIVAIDRIAVALSGVLGGPIP